MEKDYDKWNSTKKSIDSSQVSKELFFHEREIWWCSIGLNIGVESNGKNYNFERPVLIVKVFNKDMLWVVPIYSGAKNSTFFVLINFSNITSWARVSQLKCISTKRLSRKIDIINIDEFYPVINKLVKLLKSTLKNENT